MSDTPVTVRNIFELPELGAPEDSSEGWKTFQGKISEEVKSIKTAAMPDLAAKIGELFDIPISDILLASWEKTNVLQDLLAESRKSPETVMHLELAEHTIVSQHQPCIEVRIKDLCVKKLQFTLRLGFILKGFILKIQNGAIKEIQTGSCDGRGSMEYQGLTIAEKKLAPINLPGSISLPETRKGRQQASNDNAATTPESTTPS